MEKSNNQYKTYKNISQLESALLNVVEPLLVFSLSNVKKVTGWKHTTISNTLFSLKKKKILTALRKDKYVLTDKIPEHLFTIANFITQPSYLSFWTACSYYGLTEQQPKTIQVISTKQYPQQQVLNYKIETTAFQIKKWFGYQQIERFLIAEKEKLFLDCLYKPEKAGGIEEIKKCLVEAWPELELNKLKKYLLKFNNKAIFARLGFLLEELKISHPLEKEFLRNLPKSYSCLNPSKKKTNKYNKKWRIIINDQ